MNVFLNYIAKVAPVIAIGVTFISCNKDDIIESEVQKPRIVLDNEDGVYSVKQGNMLTISPEFINCDDADISWFMDGKIVCTTTSWSRTWDNPEGEYYITVNAKNAVGSASEEIRVDVLTLTPPIISLAIPEHGFIVETNTDFVLTPNIQHSDIEGFKISWSVNDILVCDSVSYTFNQSTPGIYHIVIEAENIDGKSSKEFDIEVLDTIPATVVFPTPSYLSTNTTRYTFANRPVCLRPLIENFKSPKYSWRVNDKDADCESEIYKFTPTQPGEYTVTVIVADSDKKVSASVSVICVDVSENERMRQSKPTDSGESNKVYEYIPAPGQFIGEVTAYDNSAENITTPEEACNWAQNRLEKKNYVSLGSFGGYITVGFDHSLVSGEKDYDFYIQANALVTSNEPGIVWVMQDINGNGLPDDEWYELKGSEYNKADTEHFYSVTYFRSPDQSAVQWIDCYGETGTVDYLPAFHNQPNYYPKWIKNDSYTLYGPCVKSQNSFDSATGFWTNPCYEWGYADNRGNDMVVVKDSPNIHINGFKISNAVNILGEPVALAYIDFIKVQTGVLAKSGSLGEVSTEVVSFSQYPPK